MSVTVVIPFYNSAATLRRCLHSVANQSCSPLETIVVDDGSAEVERELLYHIGSDFRNECSLTILRLQQNAGAAAARNAGWDAARGEFVAFLDADDTWHSEKLALQAEWMRKHPQCAMTGHALLDAHEEYRPVLRPYRASPVTVSQLLIRNRFSTPGVMVRRDIALRFRRGQRHSEDYELWLRMAAVGLELAKSSQPLGKVHKARFGVAGLSSEMNRMAVAEFLNFVRLVREGHLGLVPGSMASIFSCFRSVRRLVNSRRAPLQ